MTTPSSVSTERRGSVALITLQRSDRRNALDDAAVAALVAALAALAEDPQPLAVVLTGAGERSFCAGYDLDCVDPDQPRHDPLPDERFAAAIHAVEGLPCPAVAALNGDAYGGGLELALACDLRVAHAGLELAMTPCRLGLLYSPQGLERFRRRLGGPLTRRLFLTAAALDATEAHRVQLVDELVAPGRVLPRALELAAEIAANAPLAVQGTRRVLQRLDTGRALDSLELTGLRDARLATLRSDDLREALLAFREGRRPRFEGR